MSSDKERPTISRRKFLSVAAASAGTLALAACGGGTTTPADTGAGAAATVPAAAGGAATAVPTAAAAAGGAATEAPTAGAAGAATEAPTAGAEGPTVEPTVAPTPTPALLGTGGQKVTFWHGLAGADGATFVQMLGTYAASKPDVTISSELFSNWNDFYQKLPTATAAGTPPDLAIMHSWGIQQFATLGILQDADTIFYQPGLIPKNDFNPALIDAITVEGKTQAVPFDNHGWINWVNTKVIKDAGLDPAKMPTNGTEFIDWAKKVTVDDAGKHPDESGFNPDRVKVWAINCGWVRFTPVSTIWQFGGDMFKDKKSLLTSDQTVAAMQYWYDLIFKHHVAPPQPPGAPGSGDLFKGNSLALMWDGTWNLNFFKDNPDAQAVMQPMNLNSLAPDGKKAVRFDSHMMIVPNGVADPNLGAAKDLIKWLSDNGETWATSGQVPARLSVQQTPTVQNIPSGKLAAAEFLEFGRPGPSHPAINEISTAYETAFSAIVAGTSQPLDALKEAESQVQPVLDRT